jgi:autophagy-related protein 5
MDAIGEKIEHEMWGGRIPVVFNLSRHEVTTMEAPLSFCQLLPRMSYLPLFTKEVREHFLPSAPALEDELWLEYKTTPLKWDLPIGVLFDLLRDDPELPFMLTVHFLGFPAKVLLRCRNMMTVRSNFMNTLKESCYLRYGHGRAASSLNEKDHDVMWHSLGASSRSEYAGLISRLDLQFGKPAVVPVRLLLNGFGEEFNYDLRLIQRPVSLLSIEGGPTTLGTTIQQILPGVALDDQGAVRPGVTILIQGISPPLTCPIEWLGQHMRHPDLFLYICVRRRSSTEVK